MNKIFIKLVLIFIFLGNVSLFAENDCSQYSKIFPLKYNECMAELKKSGKVPSKESKIKLPGSVSDSLSSAKDKTKKALGKLNTDSKLTDWVKKQLNK